MSEEERKFLEIVDLKKGFGSGAVDASDDIEQCGLSGARRSEQHT